MNRIGVTGADQANEHLKPAQFRMLKLVNDRVEQGLRRSAEDEGKPFVPSVGG